MKVLIVDDDAEIRQLLQVLLLAAGHEIIEATDGIAAWELFQYHRPSLVITDWMMPGMDGVTLIEHIRSSDQPAYIYIVLLSAKGLKDDIVQGLDAGADDYLIKPFDPEQLRARINIATRILEYERHLRGARDQLQNLATRDPLTGLFNHNAIMDYAEAEHNRAQRERTPISMVFFDIDQFRTFNERHGRETGDQMLRLIATKITTSIRAYDRAGRWSGDEFLLVLPGAVSDEAVVVCERIRNSLDVTGLLMPGKFWLHVTLSIGVAQALPDSPVVLETLLDHARKAQRNAQASGGNCVRAYIP